jgi:capsular exopolysaccharide synthesis family protein
MAPHSANIPGPTTPHQPASASLEPIAGKIEPVLTPPEGHLPPGLSAAPSLPALLRGLRRRWVAAVCLGLTLAGLTAATVWYLMTPLSVAFARIRIAYNKDWLLRNNPGGASDFKTYVRTQAQQLLNRNVIQAALASDEVRRLNLDVLGPDPAMEIEAKMGVEYHDDSEIVTPTLPTSDPVVSVTVLKAILKQYESQVIYAEERARSARLQQLEKSYNNAVANLEGKKKALAEKEKVLKTAEPSVLAMRIAELQGTIHDLQHQRDQIDSANFTLEADLDTINEVLRKMKDPTAGPGPSVKAAINADAEVKDLRTRIRRLDEQRMKYENYGRTGGPTVDAMKVRLADLREQLERREKEIEEEVKALPTTAGDGGRDNLVRSQTRITNQLAGLKKRREALEQEIKASLEEKAALGKTNPEYESSLAQVKNAEALANQLNTALESERIEQASAPRITILQEAELQRKDIKKQVLFTIAAPVAVLFGVCMFLAWLEFRQRRVLRAGEVASGLGIRVVGAVPDMPHLERRLVGPDGTVDLEGHAVLESIDAIRTLLLHSGGTQLVLVTSATNGEGKTTLATHLAGSLARAGRKTLLVDGDLRNPTAHQLFELPVQPGLSEALLSEVELADAVRPTPLEGLSFLAAGQWDREVMQALARNGLEGLFDKLRQEFEFVVIDSHPVLAATDSLLLGRQVDGVILSVLREVSQMPRVYAAAQRLAALNIRVLGAVVNAADPHEALPTPVGTHVAA